MSRNKNNILAVLNLEVLCQNVSIYLFLYIVVSYVE
jgi:hypothetical protein